MYYLHLCLRLRLHRRRRLRRRHLQDQSCLGHLAGRDQGVRCHRSRRRCSGCCRLPRRTHTCRRMSRPPGGHFPHSGQHLDYLHGDTVPPPADDEDARPSRVLDDDDGNYSEVTPRTGVLVGILWKRQGDCSGRLAARCGRSMDGPIAHQSLRGSEGREIARGAAFHVCIHLHVRYLLRTGGRGTEERRTGGHHKPVCGAFGRLQAPCRARSDHRLHSTLLDGPCRCGPTFALRASWHFLAPSWPWPSLLLSWTYSYRPEACAWIHDRAWCGCGWSWPSLSSPSLLLG
mmetsp:Transcript_18647/g.53610  ORF Transcript_18647/g.53610 Transcript_18647/m.53610 type:complete len:288 (+) Transcript_18647:211-1074(+)